MRIAAHALDAWGLEPVQLLSLPAADFTIASAVFRRADKIAHERNEKQQKAMKAKRSR